MSEDLGKDVTANVADIAKSRSLRPTEADVLASKTLRKGHKRQYRADGTYTWTCDYKTNEHGKTTKAGAEASELLMPSMRADAERHARMNPRAMDPFKPRRRGATVMRAVGSKLWGLVEGEWVRIV